MAVHCGVCAVRLYDATENYGSFRDEHDTADDVASEAVRHIRDTEWVKMTEDWSPSDFAWQGPKKEPLVTRKKSVGGKTR